MCVFPEYSEQNAHYINDLIHEENGKRLVRWQFFRVYFWNLSIRAWKQDTNNCSSQSSVPWALTTLEYFKRCLSEMQGAEQASQSVNPCYFHKRLPYREEADISFSPPSVLILNSAYKHWIEIIKVFQSSIYECGSLSISCSKNSSTISYYVQLKKKWGQSLFDQRLISLERKVPSLCLRDTVTDTTQQYNKRQVVTAYK